MQERQLPDLGENLGVPLQRLGTVEDIGVAVVFIASPAESWITGQCVYVAGAS